MNYKRFCLFFLLALLASCQDSNEKRLAENQKEAKRKEVIFTNISKNWSFYNEPINEVALETQSTWNEWRSFLAELGGKPQKTIGAFQKKSTTIVKKTYLLTTTIPPQFNNPAIKSRLSVLLTKIEMMNLFIHLDKIPDDKVVFLIGDINKELVSLQRQMDKIVEVDKIPKEEGESELIQMLKDTARAIPDTPNIPLKTSN
ncbi:hypothetical protein [Flavobacterium agrisoli]|uniref:Lipoprotein n=1 Tax=Flavobacterium agrisoli TaxID=2793066 RepID=A0A934UJD1_9FLAO|nr:hypothetical protein [Flavobacterium agrisoli]MBK0369767.1 hypothetical protein [Flavobacterium agrisoli]